jgi:hypothetical protein
MAGKPPMRFGPSPQPQACPPRRDNTLNGQGASAGHKHAPNLHSRHPPPIHPRPLPGRRWQRRRPRRHVRALQPRPNIAADFVVLDGLKAFLFTAGKIGSETKEYCGEADLLADLNTAATTNENRAAHLKVATGPPRDRQSSARHERINWGREAPPKHFAGPPSPSPKPRIPRPFPLYPAPLIAIADNRDALVALTKLTHSLTTPRPRHSARRIKQPQPPLGGRSTPQQPPTRR